MFGPDTKKRSFHTLIRMTCAMTLGVLWGGMILAQSGCGQSSKSQSPDPQNEAWGGENAAADPALQAEGQAVFRPLGKRRENASGTPLNSGGSEAVGTGSRPGISVWSIVVAVVPPSANAAEQEAFAKELLEKIQTVGKLPDAMLQRRSNSTVIVSGRSYDGMTAEATGDLEKIREIIVGGQFPYARAYLAPPETMVADTSTRSGSISQYDLRSIGAGKPAKMKFFSLEVAVYGHEDRRKPTAEEAKSFRTAAEDAVKTLRDQGHEAYFFHGANSSSVTVGVFTEADYDKYAREGIAIAKARQLFPHVLLNGAALRDKNQGGKLAPCQVVNVPR